MRKDGINRRVSVGKYIYIDVKFSKYWRTSENEKKREKGKRGEKRDMGDRQGERE